MLGIGQRVPAQKIFRAFRHVRNHLEQHDGFVEMVQVVGGKPGAGIDVGGAQLRGARLSIGPAWRGVGRSDGAGVEAVEVICRSVNGRG